MIYVDKNKIMGIPPSFPDDKSIPSRNSMIESSEVEHITERPNKVQNFSVVYDIKRAFNDDVENTIRESNHNSQTV